MSDDRAADTSNEQEKTLSACSSATSPPEASSTRRTALGMTAAATAAILADRAILAPGSARAEPEVVESVNKKTGKVVGIAEVNTEGPEKGKLLETQVPSSVVTSSADGFAPSVIWLDTTPEYYGAKGDGVTNDTAAFQACSEAVKAVHGGKIRLSAKTYVVDGLLWESGIYWEGRGPGTVLEAVHGSSNEGVVELATGGVNGGGFKNMTVKGHGNAEQDLFYLNAAAAGAGVSSAVFENVTLLAGAEKVIRNAMWFRGGPVEPTTPHQFITFKNVYFGRGTATTSRCLKATGQCAKFEFDAACIWGGTGAYEGTNIELSREFLLTTTLSAEAALEATEITVASTAGLEEKKKFSIGEGFLNELCEVASIAGSKVKLVAPLARAHAAAANLYALSGTVSSPATWAPVEWTFHSGAIQSCELSVLADSARLIDFDLADFEAQSNILRARNGCKGVNLNDCSLLGASKGTNFGQGAVTAGSDKITGTTKEWKVGMKIAGPGIPLNTEVTKVEGSTITISNNATASGAEKGTVDLISESNGEGYIASFEERSRGNVTGSIEGNCDRYVIGNNQGCVIFTTPVTGVEKATQTSSGVTLALPAAEELTIYRAREVVLTNAGTIQQIVGMHATGDKVTLRATAAETILRTGGNLYLAGKSKVELATGECAVLQRTDYGSSTWILVGVGGEKGAPGAGSAKADLALAARGLLTESYPMAVVASSLEPTAGTIYGTPVGLFKGEKVTNLLLVVGTAGAGTAPTLIRLGLANDEGTIVAVTENLHSSALFTAISKPAAICPLTSPYEVPTSGGYCIVVIQAGAWGTTQMKLGRSSTGALLNTNLGAKLGTATYGAANLFGAGKTDLPEVGKTLEAATGTSTAFWFGAS